MRYYVKTNVAALAMALSFASAWAAPVGTAITYQGQIKQGDVPVSQTCDFEFTLWDDPVATLLHNQVGPTLIFDGQLGNSRPVRVVNGLFQIELDFKDDAFNGDARWLEIAVRCPSGAGIFTTLAPRQRLTSAPQALFSTIAPWNGLDGVPPGFADGIDDDTVGGLSCAGGQVAKWNAGLAQWECAVDEAGAGGNTLDQAYDQGGAGAGRTITADSGPVNIAGTDGLTVNGNVGIGGATLNAALNVLSNNDLPARFDRVDAATGSAVDLLTLRANTTGTADVGFGGSLVWDVESGNGGTTTGAGRIDVAWNDATVPNQSADMLFRLRGAGEFPAVEKMRITGDGNVGIGTTSPGAKLHVSGGDILLDNNKALRAKDNTGIGQIILRMSTLDSTDLENNAGSGIRLIINNIPSLIVTSNGNVGIGTSGPTARLQVAGDVSNNKAIWAIGTVLVSKALNESGTGLSVSRTTAAAPFFVSFRTEVDGNAIDAFGGIFGSGNAPLHLNRDSSGNVLLTNGGGKVGIGTTNPQVRIHVEGGTDTALTGGGYLVLGSTTSINISIDNNEIMARNNGLPATLFLNNNGGAVRVRVLQIAGADLAEKFPVSEEMEPGMVVEIDPDNPGKLRIARGGAYNRRVAGVVSGANGLSVGVVLGYVPEQEDAPPIALSGRVYVQADTTNGPIHPGDLLTTSNAPGRAMKVKDYGKAQGAILGKAMTPLKEGKGLVLVLVTLQ